MFVLEGDLTLLFVVDGTEPREITLEVENDVIPHQKVEGNHSLSRNRSLGISGDVECQIIGNVADVGFPLLGKFL